MKVIILAGGFGTRLAEYTDMIPKPMVNVGSNPILFEIMDLFSSYGHNDFYIALGYKSEVVKDFFLNYYSLNSDLKVNLKNNSVDFLNNKKKDWTVHLIDTGTDSMTGGRVKRMQEFIGDDDFLLTYGDGLSNINMDELIDFHNINKKIMTVTAVRPSARFGEISIENGIINSFEEKPQGSKGWINGGFMVCKNEIFNYIDSDETILEKDTMENLAKQNELAAFKHNGFWYCMDTKRDKDFLDSLSLEQSPPWKKLS